MHFAQRVRALVVLNGVALLPLFAPWSGIPRLLYALFAGRKGMPAIARYFMDELTTRLANGV
ncbi:hypothetical protein NAJ88_000284 [Escherichia coli]|uniref:hypothetical protein n=1 Tax=Escherichia coli TaxID=562 RepID=UPI0010B35086|nr:hypothetical protein [Escherichia coli]EHH8204490.1 hypothetical protein [Escherichia coli]EIB9591040.1 hypothetical protein [Escherichia coli]EJB8600622.1 hypothetical protein [Escherichia coli]EJG7179713.1 hypothetical protein [Escherichia coli]EKI8674089.1 hypothetical protein [Escherichia coli]